MGLDRRQLALEAKHAGGNQRLLGEEAGVVDQKTRGEIVGAVEHNVVVCDTSARMLSASTVLVIGVDRDLRIDRR